MARHRLHAGRALSLTPATLFERKGPCAKCRVVYQFKDKSEEPLEKWSEQWNRCPCCAEDAWEMKRHHFWASMCALVREGGLFLADEYLFEDKEEAK